ncbi:cobyrinate a,c-diamide synthase [Undibacterium cyanobacteriorum]|uniref:Cobyrinate a,c-diamide synthase n=1 Tax=Undibacterium cyanobacteriorum TaxID=3073561 RepID=A0ABY9RG56_9BURK|nr:cobyrinate a,c-diamide synthase [Undibacterium sp. 20NA77.5]WMW79285.1 cobyrinate a,c-diamide synthase [Undibacterium sp. 20NA77.5]
MVTAAPILMISAIGSGQGKTSVTAALARRLVQAGKKVRVFKTGADFIDPMMLEFAAGSSVESLDLWLTGAETCRTLLAQAAAEADLVLVEGVMGLYDGSPSSADLAKAFDIPVVLVIDASAMAQTIGAVATGLRDYGGVQLAGVIANRVAAPGHVAMLKESLRDLPLLGHLPRQTKIFPERHLGLVLPEEQADLNAVVDDLARNLVLDESWWQARMTSLPHSEMSAENRHGQCSHASSTVLAHRTESQSLAGRCIAIARDPAFAFIYPANIACLISLGAELVFFSPLCDEAVPEYADAVFLPGGYPELHAEVLSRARLWQASIRRKHSKGLPIVAECGGMMALASQLIDQDSRTWAMAGLLEGSIHVETRLQALGMQSLASSYGQLRGHSFHFSRFETRLSPSQYAVKQNASIKDTSEIQEQDRGEAVYRMHGLIASYFHAYFPSNPSATAALFLGNF